MVVELKLLQALLSTGAKDVYRKEVGSGHVKLRDSQILAILGG